MRESAEATTCIWVALIVCDLRGYNEQFEVYGVNTERHGNTVQLDQPRHRSAVAAWQSSQQCIAGCPCAMPLMSTCLARALCETALHALLDATNPVVRAST